MTKITEIKPRFNKIMDAKYFQSESKSRWNSQRSYRLIIWAWMMNEMSTVFAVAHISHHGYYIPIALYTASACFIGIPLLYSEICVTQYTNCDSFSMWDFFPLMRGVGYSAIYLVILKTLYVMTLSIWYVEYAIYSTTDTPPWFSCQDFNETICMVKRINISVFQHCLETQFLFEEDCGMRTSSFCFFQREIGDHNTFQSTNCMIAWEKILASGIISFTLFAFTLKNEKFIQIFVKVLAVYTITSVFILLSIALSTSGAWYSSKAILGFDFDNFSLYDCLEPIYLGFLSLGTGYGIINYISRDVDFRSNALMTAIGTSLFSVCFTALMSMVIFSGTRTMSYYHGEEENIIEFGYNYFFTPLGSISEILSYFDGIPAWSFIWFLSIFMCLYATLWIQYLFLRTIMLENISFARKYYNLFSAFISVSISLFSWPFLCSDLAASLNDAVDVLQIINSLLFSISVYWIYGYKKHGVDIVFMIGIKSKYFIEILWLLNPFLIMFVLGSKIQHWAEGVYDVSYTIVSLDMRSDELIFLVLLNIHFAIFIIGMFYEICIYFRQGKILTVLLSTDDWGPVDPILNRSRRVFVPETMTTEFLYRQVRIHTYVTSVPDKQSTKYKRRLDAVPDLDKIDQWSILTSN